MHLLPFRSDRAPGVAIVRGDLAVDLAELGADFPATRDDQIAGGEVTHCEPPPVCRRSIEAHSCRLLAFAHLILSDRNGGANRTGRFYAVGWLAY
jgi:hypothetical protein